MNVKTAFKILGYHGKVVVDFADIKKKYRKKSLEVHPDMPEGSDILFKQVSDAYQLLLTTCSEGTSYNLDELACTIKQGSTPLSYIVKGVTVNFLKGDLL